MMSGEIGNRKMRSMKVNLGKLWNEENKKVGICKIKEGGEGGK